LNNNEALKVVDSFLMILINKMQKENKEAIKLTGLIHLREGVQEEIGESLWKR